MVEGIVCQSDIGNKYERATRGWRPGGDTFAIGAKEKILEPC